MMCPTVQGRTYFFPLARPSVTPAPPVPGLRIAVIELAIPV